MVKQGESYLRESEYPGSADASARSSHCDMRSASHLCERLSLKLSRTHCLDTRFAVLGRERARLVRGGFRHCSQAEQTWAKNCRMGGVKSK